jgi:adenylate cyclase
MPDLVAQGGDSTQRWRAPVPDDQPLLIGRDPNASTLSIMATPWDQLLSRQHIEVHAQASTLFVRKLASAANPVFFRGRSREKFSLETGEHFVVGDTSFLWTESGVDISVRGTPAVTEQTFSFAELKRAKFRNADQRIDALSRLPEMLAGVTSDNELFIRLVNVLLTAVPESTEVAIVSLPQDAAAFDVLHWDRRRVDGEPFAASERLLHSAVETGESTAHVWETTPRENAFTQRENVDWAFCVPLRGLVCAGWALYVAGCFADPADDCDPQSLRDDVKFTELCAATLQHHFETRLLERRQSSLRPFFSPVVLEALAGKDPEELLEPRESNVTVLFCDLRGFSRSSEESADDLMGLLKRVSQALGIMTHHILAEGGVVGDFHGDAAMGFWGWPFPSDDDVQRACRAALAIRQAFEEAKEEDASLSGFQAGIGMATGRAVAGGIGTSDQLKVTVFGPVVNLASRLEGLTGQLHASILVDHSTAIAVREKVPKDVARLRRVARVRPYGMVQSEDVHELLPPSGLGGPLSDQDIDTYESAVQSLIDGNWEVAFTTLHAVPAADRVKDFLTVYIARHDRTPPADWDGVISMERK